MKTTRILAAALALGLAACATDVAPKGFSAEPIVRADLRGPGPQGRATPCQVDPATCGLD